MPNIDIGLAGIAAAIVAQGRPDDQVVEAVAIDIAGRRDAPARVVAGRIALDDEALGRVSVVRSITWRPPTSVPKPEAVPNTT